MSETDKERYVTVTFGGAGYFAVLMWFNPDLGGFWEPWQTGIGRYGIYDLAVKEAKEWAEAENIKYKEGGK